MEKVDRHDVWNLIDYTYYYSNINDIIHVCIKMITIIKNFLIIKSNSP